MSDDSIPIASTAVVPLSYDALPPGSDLVVRRESDGVTIVSPAGPAHPAAVRAAALSAAIWAATLMAALLFAAAVFLVIIQDPRRIGLWFRVLAAVCFAVVGAMGFLLLWQTQAAEAIATVSAARSRNVAVRAARRKVLIEASGGGLDPTSLEIPVDSIVSITVERAKTWAGAFRAPSVVIRRAGDPPVPLFSGRQPPELRLIALALREATGISS